MIRILIVDDEVSASNLLKILFEKYIAVPHEIIVCNRPEEALEIVEQFDPTLVMLDIEMPNMNGFDLLNKMCYWNFDVIFTTAYDKYAIKAIRFSAMDYLLKPIDVVDLQNAINKHIVRQAAGSKQQQLVTNLLGNLNNADHNQFKLAINTMEGVYFFEPMQIIRLEGESNYTRFHIVNQRPLLVSKTLKEFEEILTEYNFIRVHKSNLVNKAFVKHLDKEDFLWLTDGSKIAVSRRKKDEVLKSIGGK